MISLPAQANKPESQLIPRKPAVTGLQHRPDIQPLSRQRVQFEIDMCVGCDRCMRACPVPLSATVTIAELNYATVSDTMTPLVARFTEECVMCGSCVPVCPVDNHRDLLMLSLKQRLGVVWDKQVDMLHIQQSLPAGWSIPLLLRNLREQAIFADAQVVPDQYLLHLTAASRLLVVNGDELLLVEGEFGRDLYIILDGRFELSSLGSQGTALPVGLSGRGEYLGGYAMLTGQPQPVSVRALTPSVVLLVPEQVMQSLMEIRPQVRSFFERVSDGCSLASILRRLALFQGVAEPDITWIARHSRITRHERDGQLLAEDGRGQPSPRKPAYSARGFCQSSATCFKRYCNT